MLDFRIRPELFGKIVEITNNGRRGHKRAFVIDTFAMAADFVHSKVSIQNC